MKRRMIAIFTMLCLCLSACGQSMQEEALEENSQEAATTEDITEEKEKHWIIEEQILPDADTAAADMIPPEEKIYAEEWYLVKETVYRVLIFVNRDDSVSKGEFFKGYGIQKLEPPYAEWMNTYIAPKDWIEGEICEPLQFDGGDVMTEEGHYAETIVENNQTGEIYFTRPAECQYDAAISGMRYSGIQIVSSDGQVLLSSKDIHAGGDEKIWFTTETEGYLYQNFCIAEFSLKEGKLDIIYDFSKDAVCFDKMYNSRKELKYMSIRNGIQGGYAKEDGSHVLLVACGDGTWQLWQMREEDGQTADSQKQVLEWATTLPSGYEQLAVNAFNKQSKEYEIVFRLPDQGEDYADFRTRIQAELSAGEGPDLLSAGAAIDVEAAARKGFLLDLTEYFAEYEEVMLPSAWKLGLEGGHRYAVPYSCTITTVVTDKRLIEDKERWTLDEAIGYMEKSDAGCFMAGAGEAELFFYLGLLTETNEQLVDWENGISHLDSETGVNLLEFAHKYADHESTAGNEYARTAEGEAMTALLYLLSPEDMRVAAAMFENQEAYIGFPVENGESSHLIHGSSLAVNQASPCVEGALAFIRFLLSEAMQSDMARKTVENSAAFPVLGSAMEQVYAYLQEEEGTQRGRNRSGGLEYEAVPLSDESIQKLRRLIETARPMGNRAAPLFSIVEEEISNFQSEGRTAQQVLGSVNNRAQLYLYESAYGG